MANKMPRKNVDRRPTNLVCFVSMEVNLRFSAQLVSETKAIL